MIQRIQSLYLLLSAVLVGLSIISPLVEFASYNDFARLSAFSLETTSGDSEPWQLVSHLWALGILFSATALLNVVIIFLYKKRMLQIRLTRYSLIMKVALVAVIVYFSFVLNNEIKAYSPDLHEIKPCLGSLFVVVAMVLDWLALKAIRKDEALVQSIDRIR